jgi:phosphopantothenate synthetase
MICKIAWAAVVAIALTASPAFAKSKTAGCSDDGIAKADAAVMKVPDGDKTAAMQEMTSAKSSMSQKGLAGCSMHMSKAMKVTTMKTKKM